MPNTVVQMTKSDVGTTVGNTPADMWTSGNGFSLVTWKTKSGLVGFELTRGERVIDGSLETTFSNVYDALRENGLSALLHEPAVTGDTVVRRIADFLITNGPATIEEIQEAFKGKISPSTVYMNLGHKAFVSAPGRKVRFDQSAKNTKTYLR